MTDPARDPVETLLGRYRPAEAPAELLDRVGQAAMGRRPTRRGPVAATLSTAAELVVGLAIRGVLTAAAAVVLVLVSAKGS
jgi:hypothetical protein